MAIMAHYPGVVEKILAEYDEIIAEEGDLGAIISGFLDPEDQHPGHVRGRRGQVQRQL